MPVLLCAVRLNQSPDGRLRIFPVRRLDERRNNSGNKFLSVFYHVRSVSLPRPGVNEVFVRDGVRDPADLRDIVPNVVLAVVA